MISETVPEPRPVLGWLGFTAGAGALLMALIVFWAGPFAPQDDISVSLGELAVNVGKATARAAAGLPQPAPEVPGRDIDDYLAIAVATLGGAAIVISLAGFLRREDWRPVVAGVALGGSAILFQVMTMMVLVIACVILIGLFLNGIGLEGV